ncbi:MAG: bifunctional (p)ppGpp synthetase/guanosine-3',5'-bis(diphosphate) 3'-pyrophosphohydrolase [Candidatus Liptonbacteria bacterium]|nr:bifunctional (p)ppGpp synthetase/guanosine-3',5'-bis(diphosphate) 3'-pyrophosphohydrolase [Candidatus Liptonbacteria bacterium]
MSLKTFIQQHPRVADAYAFAESVHRGQTRKNGQPYVDHVTNVAATVAELNLDEETVIAALLHDIVEQTPHILSDVENRFGATVARLVGGVERLGAIKYRGNKAQRTAVRVSILGSIDDVRTLIIKLADRLDSMRTIRALPADKQTRIAAETADIYAPLASQLGMQRIGGELAERSFPVLHPKEYENLVASVRDQYRERTAYLKKITPLLVAELGKNTVPLVSMDYRAKHYHSLHEKLQRTGKDLGTIYDLIAIRLIVPSVESCYAALGAVHALWPPVPGRIKDYIALPKQNGYRSLHTTVFSPENKITEIQIRTSEMHEQAENGIAAHWAYKEGNTAAAARFNGDIIQRLRQWREDPGNPQSFRIDFFKDRIFVNTPKGEIVDLPAGATPVDFAYQIHSDVGDTCRGAFVNGKAAALDFRLRSGDVVKIVTQKNKKPSASWLAFVQTNAAKSRIRAHLKKKRSLDA